VTHLARVALLGLLGACARPGDPRPPAVPERTRATEAEPGACVGPGPAPVAAGARDVDGRPRAPSPARHRTGVARDGFCASGPDDPGVHAVCARVTEAFLAFSRSRGNDLVTPRGAFPGLRDGDGWCLCAARWREADEAGVAPPVVRSGTSDAALATIDRAALDRHALPEPR
jgi:uncharacterized protein (DUF2237 family)